MNAKETAALAGEIAAMLEPLTEQDRERVIAAVNLLVPRYTSAPAHDNTHRPPAISFSQGTFSGGATAK